MLVGKVFEERHNVVSAFKSGKKKNNMGNIKSHVASENHSHKQTKKSNTATAACFFCRAQGFHELTQIEKVLILARTLQDKGHLIAMYVQDEMTIDGIKENLPF